MLASTGKPKDGIFREWAVMNASHCIRKKSVTLQELYDETVYHLFEELCRARDERAKPKERNLWGRF